MGDSSVHNLEYNIIPNMTDYIVMMCNFPVEKGLNGAHLYAVRDRRQKFTV